MATKAQIIDYISENYNDSEGMPVSLPKLDGYKKAELEKFIKDRNEEANLEDWLNSKK